MNILISVLLFSAFGFAQTTPACFQIWEAQNEFNAVYGMWEPKEFHSNGLRLAVLYQNPTAAVGSPFGRYVILMASIAQAASPGHAEVLVYRSDKPIENIRINWFGDVAFNLLSETAPPGSSYASEDQVVICGASWTANSLEPSYACANQPGAAIVVDRIPYSRPGIFGPNTMPDGKVTGLEWSLSGQAVLTYSNYRFSGGATVNLFDFDLWNPSQGPISRWSQPAQVINGSIPSSFLRLAQPDSFTDTVASQEILLAPGIFPRMWGINERVHGGSTVSGYQNAIYHGASTMDSIASFGTASAFDGASLSTHAFYTRVNNENAARGLYFTASSDAPSYSTEHRLSPIGSSSDYESPLSVIGRVNAVAVSVGRYLSPVTKRTEFYTFDPVSGQYGFDRALVPPLGQGFTAIAAVQHPFSTSGYRVGGYLASGTSNRKLAAFDCP